MASGNIINLWFLDDASVLEDANSVIKGTCKEPLQHLHVMTHVVGENMMGNTPKQLMTALHFIMTLDLPIQPYDLCNLTKEFSIE